MLFWDASALIKRYAPEEGSDTVSSLFESIPISEMASTLITFSECYSLLQRRHNGGLISTAAFGTALTSLENDFLGTTSLNLFAVRDEDYLAGTAIITKHNLNSTDATLLNVILRQAALALQQTYVVVASDHRLLRAASAEKLNTLNPSSLTSEQAKAQIEAL
jgi:predicted nucleic acid-binding protein